MLVGEQPGDQEDLQGHPFVGPAGKLLARALEAGGHPARADLRLQRGQALQVRTARQAPHPQEPDAARDRRLPSLAGRRDRAGAADRAGGAGRDRGALAARTRRAGDGRARPVAAARRTASKVLVTLHPSALLRLQASTGRPASRRSWRTWRRRGRFRQARLRQPVVPGYTRRRSRLAATRRPLGDLAQGSVIPAKAGIQGFRLTRMDTGRARNDWGPAGWLVSYHARHPRRARSSSAWRRAGLRRCCCRCRSRRVALLHAIDRVAAPLA